MSYVVVMLDYYDEFVTDVVGIFPSEIAAREWVDNRVTRYPERDFLFFRLQQPESEQSSTDNHEGRLPCS